MFWHRSCAGGRAACQGSAHVLLSPFHGEHVGSGRWAPRSSRAGLRHPSRAPVPSERLRAGHRCHSQTLNKYQWSAAIRPYCFLGPSMSFQFNSKDCQFGLPIMKLIKRCPVSLTFHPFRELSPSFISSRQPESLAVRPMVFLLWFTDFVANCEESHFWNAWAAHA